MAAIPPNNNIDGFIKSMKDGVYGAYNKGVKYGRYLAQQEYLKQKKEQERHGYWYDPYKQQPEARDMVYCCSECNSAVFKTFSPTMNYCPNCGAKMDGEGES